MAHPCSQGEVDIVEGVNDQVPNASSLHTSPGMLSTVTIDPNLVIDRTKIAFRMYYAPVSPRNWVSVQPTNPRCRSYR
jgi:hypothetical protein